MSSTSPKSPMLHGIRDGLPFILVLAPFGVLFGVVGTEAGLSIYETLAFSAIVAAGAAQFAALQQMSENAPTLIVLATALAVNLRMAMYSASLTQHFGGAPLWQRAMAAYFLVDQTYALGITKFDAEPERPVAWKLSYFFGVMIPVFISWYLTTIFGALAGQQLPPGLALDFALPITFLAMVGPMLKTPAHVAAALMSVTAALAFAWLPFNTGLLVAALLAMATGAEVERRMARREV